VILAGLNVVFGHAFLTLVFLRLHMRYICTVLAGTIMAAVASLATPAVAQNLREPNVGADLFFVNDELLKSAKDAYQKDGAPSAEVWCTVQEKDGTLSTNQVTALLESDINNWLIKASIRILGVADRGQELRQLGAINLAAPDALANALKRRNKGKLAFVVALFPSVDPDRLGYEVRVQLLDLREGLPLYDKSTPLLRVQDAEVRRKLSASVCRNTLDAYAKFVNARPAERVFQVLLVGLENREQARAVTKRLADNGVVMNKEVEVEFDAGTSQCDFEVTTERTKEQLIEGIAAALNAEGIAHEVVADGGNKLTVSAGNLVGISRQLMRDFSSRYLADGRPDLRLLVGLIQNGEPNKVQVNDDRGVGPGLKSSIVAELGKNRDLQYRDEFAQGAVLEGIVNQLQENNEPALAAALTQQYGRTGLALLVGLQPLNPQAAQGAAAKLFVRLVDLRREGKVLAQFAEDWPAARGFAQKQLDQQARALLSRVLKNYIDPSVTAEVVLVQMVGLEQEDGLADAIAGVIETQVQGVAGRVTVELPRPAAGGETVTTFRLPFTGDARQLREELRRVLRSPIGIPCRFYAGTGSTQLVRVGRALEVPPWVALTDQARPGDDEFVKQLGSTLAAMGRPKFGVVVLEDGAVSAWRLNALQPMVETELRGAGCDVVSSKLLEQLRLAMVQQHGQFHISDGLAQSMAFGNVVDCVLLLRPTGSGSAVAELIDVRNGRLFGAVALPSGEMSQIKVLRLNVDDPTHVGRYVAGSAMTFLIRQAGVPNITEVVLKNARSAADLDSIAELLLSLPNVVGANQRSFAYGVGRLMLAYNGPFDVIAGRINRDSQTLTFPVRVERSSSGLVELFVKERAVFVPRPPPPAGHPGHVAPAPVPGLGPASGPPASAPPSTPAPAPAGQPSKPPGSASPPPPGSGNIVLISPSGSASLSAAWIDPAQQALPAAAPVVGNNYALIVAVDTFEKQKPLNASKDAAKLFVTLKQYCGFKDDNVILLANGFKDNFAAPTGRNVLSGIDKISRAAGPDDTILILFSTHGTVDAKNETSLVPSDESKGLISVADIRAKLSGSRARTSVLILDACQSAGRFDKVTTSPGSLAAGSHRDGAGLITLAGCRADESSFESSAVNGGIFTHFLCKGLQGAADQWEKGNKDSEVSLSELYLYTHRQVQQFAASLKDEHGKPLNQNPTKLGIETGDIVLVRRKAN